MFLPRQQASKQASKQAGRQASRQAGKQAGSQADFDYLLADVAAAAVAPFVIYAPIIMLS